MLILVLILIKLANIRDNIKENIMANISSLILALIMPKNFIGLDPGPCIIKLFTTVRVYHSKSLPHYSSICRQGWSLPVWSPLWDSTLMVGSQPCLQIFNCVWKVTNTLAYCDTGKITAIKSFRVNALLKLKSYPPLSYYAYLRSHGNLIHQSFFLIYAQEK